MDVLNRTFVGIPVSTDICEALERTMQIIKRKPGVDNIRWNQHSELLISLASLGELGVGTINALRVTLPPIVARFPAMDLLVKGFAGLPNMIQPRYCYAGIEDDNGVLTAIANAVEAAATPFVPHRDIKPFKPYIILGRLKTESEQFRVALGRALKLTEQPEVGTMHVAAIDILVSNASTSGMAYELVQRMPLQG